MATIRYNRIAKVWEVTYKDKQWVYRTRETAETKAKLINGNV